MVSAVDVLNGLMLVLGICDVMLRSMERLCGVFCSSISTSTSISSRAVDTEIDGVELDESTGTYHCDRPGCYHHHPRTQTQRQEHENRPRLGDWSLDTEDRNQAIHTLLEARLSKFDGLVNKLENVVYANNWGCQKKMVRMLREHFARIVRLTGDMDDI